MACAARSVDSNAFVGLPLASKRKTFAGEPPAAYKTPLGSIRNVQRKEASASASSVNFGESSRRPSLRTVTPLDVPFRNSSYVDWRQLRVCSAREFTANSVAHSSSAATTAITLVARWKFWLGIEIFTG